MGKDEFGNLGNSFNSMASKLQQTTTSIVELEHEITERKQAEKALRESEERYRTLVVNLPVAVYRNTPGPKGAFLMANPAFCKMFGFNNEEEVLDFTPANLYQNPKKRKEYSDNLIRKGVIKNDEWTLLKRDGTSVYTSITSRVVHGQDGEVSHFDSIMLDITDQKKLESQLQQSQKMEAVGILAGGIAHDYNNLLAVIMGNLSMAQEEAEPHSAMAELLYEIEQASYKARDLTHQFLTLSEGGHPRKELGTM
ncbi:MAG: PAS domain S-box protein, partial [Nitrospina sp.]|nr:PAS domain S-box protein [Nitrospina sp.]